MFLKVSSEKEVLRHEAAEHKERVSQLEKSERQLEVDNERLAFKVKIFHNFFFHIHVLHNCS